MGMDMDQETLILIRTHGTRIHQPAGFPIPVSNTSGNFLVKTGILRLNAIDQGTAIMFNLLDNWRDGDA